jgi:hypothetical protein
VRGSSELVASGRRPAHHRSVRRRPAWLLFFLLLPDPHSPRPCSALRQRPSSTPVPLTSRPAPHRHTLLLHPCTASPAPAPQLLRIHSSCAACQSPSARAPPELLLLRPRAAAAHRGHPARQCRAGLAPGRATPPPLAPPPGPRPALLCRAAAAARPPTEPRAACASAQHAPPGPRCSSAPPSRSRAPHLRPRRAAPCSASAPALAEPRELRPPPARALRSRACPLQCRTARPRLCAPAARRLPGAGVPQGAVAWSRWASPSSCCGMEKREGKKQGEIERQPGEQKKRKAPG